MSFRIASRGGTGRGEQARVMALVNAVVVKRPPNNVPPTAKSTPLRHQYTRKAVTMSNKGTRGSAKNNNKGNKPQLHRITVNRGNREEEGESGRQINP